MADDYTIHTGSKAMQPARVHQWLSEHSYWAQGIPLQTVEVMIEHSFCVGAFCDGVQIGFARFVTDYAVFAYLADVYVEEAHRGRGLGKRMIEALMNEPFVKNLRRLLLATKDAHGLYEQFGFLPLRYPDRMMEISHTNIYPQKTNIT